MSDPRWLTIARDLIGLKEIKGPQTEPEIVRLWRDAGLTFTDDETAWCAGFVGGVLARANIKPTKSAAARSYCDWGVDCWHGGALSDIPLGAVLVFSRPPSTWSGHVGFATGFTQDGRVMCLGGNQKDSVNIAPFDVARLIATRWPVEETFDPVSLPRLALITTNLNSSMHEA